MTNVRSVLITLSIALMLLLSPSAYAQEDASLSGHWTGLIHESRSTDFPQYTLSVHIDTDRGGRPVGVVEYDAFPCAGVRDNASLSGSVWRLDETITRGGDRCARHVIIELTPRGNVIDIRLWPPGLEDMPSSGQLHRRS